MRRLDAGFDRVDAFQRRHRVVGFPHAVFKRYGEDRGGWLGAVISYYGFFSLLPALLAFVTVVYMVLGSRPRLLAEVLSALWATLPFVGEAARQHVKPIPSTGPVLVISLGIALWGAVGVVRVVQDALNIMWCVPTYRRPGFFPKLARGLAVLGLIGLLIAVAGVTTAVTLKLPLPVLGVIAAAVVNIVVGLVLAVCLFRVLTARRLSIAQLWPGALVAGLGMYGLTLLGGLYVDRVIARASAIYGSFAAVIGLLGWITLVVQVFVLGNLVNVVRVERLWPRTMTGRNLGPADARAVRLTMRREAMVSETRWAEVAPGTPLAGEADPGTRAG